MNLDANDKYSVENLTKLVWIRWIFRRSKGKRRFDNESFHFFERKFNWNSDDLWKSGGKKTSSQWVSQSLAIFQYNEYCLIIPILIDLKSSIVRHLPFAHPQDSNRFRFVDHFNRTNSLHACCIVQWKGFTCVVNNRTNLQNYWFFVQIVIMLRKGHSNIPIYHSNIFVSTCSDK